MRLPRITHLQYLILASLADSGRSGFELRARLAEYGAKKSLPAFYQLMDRLEKSGLVTGRYELRTIEGSTSRERTYRITPDGHAARGGALNFYGLCPT